MSQSGPDPITIACAIEGVAYTAHCSVMLRSLLDRNRESRFEIYCLHGGDISRPRQERMRSMVEFFGSELGFISMDRSYLSGLPTKGFTKRATWYRIYLPEVLGDLDRVLYLDADILVVASIRDLWETDISNHYLAAVTNVMELHNFSRVTEKFGLPSKECYFNAGVMLMNLERMRSDGCTAAIRDYAVRNSAEIGWRDQDALNIVLYKRRLPLHPRWNCMVSVLNFPWAVDYFGEAEVAEARAAPAILHFEGPAQNKPWHLLSPPGVRRLYREERRHTPWPRLRPEGITPGNLLRYARARGTRDGGV